MPLFSEVAEYLNHSETVKPPTPVAEKRDENPGKLVVREPLLPDIKCAVCSPSCTYGSTPTDMELPTLAVCGPSPVVVVRRRWKLPAPGGASASILFEKHSSLSGCRHSMSNNMTGKAAPNGHVVDTGHGAVAPVFGCTVFGRHNVHGWDPATDLYFPAAQTSHVLTPVYPALHRHAVLVVLPAVETEFD